MPSAAVSCLKSDSLSWDEYEAVDDIDIRNSLGTLASEPEHAQRSQHAPELSGVDFTASGEQEAAEAEDDSVLLGVSKMLVVLKGHVSKARSR